MSANEDIFSIFILKSNPSVLGSAEAFLRNRNWDVNSATSLREAMAFLIKHQPQFVLISVDHPNQKVRALPKLLAQAFQCRVIPMAEKPSPAATKALLEMNPTYHLNAPVSGPGIQRLILKIRKDDENQNNESTKIGISKNSAATSEPVHITGGLDSARTALNQLLAMETDSPPESSGSPIVQEGGGKKDGLAYWGGAAQNNSSGALPDQTPGSVNTGAAYQPDQQQKTGESFADYAERMRNMAESHAGWETAPKKSNLAYMPNSGTGNKANPNFIGTMEGESDWGKPGAGPPILPNMDGPYIEKQQRKSADFIRDLSKEDLSKQPLIQQGTQAALNQASNMNEPLEEGQLQSIEKASNVACITVDSPNFKGYLICALGKNRSMDITFVDTLRARLAEFLRANGEVFSDKDSMQLRIQEVEFDEWALNQAEFLRKSIHHEDEVAVAFFPTAEIDPPVVKSASEIMLQMELKELKEDTALEFDLYVFLPENQKYLLYTPQGMVFYTSQKGRLREKGVTHMHLRKDSLSQVKKYRAQNFLNEKIAEFKAKALKKPSN